MSNVLIKIAVLLCVVAAAIVGYDHGGIIGAMEAVIGWFKAVLGNAAQAAMIVFNAAKGW